MENVLFVGLIIFLLLLFIYIKYSDKKKKLIFLDNYQYPESLFTMLQDIYPNIQKSDLNLIKRGLKDYFKLYIISNRRTIIVPSIILDRLWFQFIQMNEYIDFSNNTFGFYLHKAPIKGLKNNFQEIDTDIKVSWILACESENIDPKNPNKIPLIFSLDSKYNVSDDYLYTINNENPDYYNLSNIGDLGFSTAHGGRNF
jgi:hypothetical protein